MKCSVVHLVDAYLVVHEQQYVKVDPNLYIREDLVSCAEDLLTLIAQREKLSFSPFPEETELTDESDSEETREKPQAKNVRVRSTEFLPFLLRALNRHIDNSQDDIKKVLRKFRADLKHEEHKEKLIEDLALLKEEVVRDRKYKENFQIRPHVWVNERYIRYFIAFILASFFFVLTMCYSFLVNGLVPTVYVTDINECLNSTTCANTRNSFCVNTYGSYLCLCKEGYVNQNGSCLRPTTDFCALQHDQFCDPRAKCVNLVDKAACLCLDGYKGDGTYCVDMAHLPLLDKMEIISDEFTTSNLRLLNVINSNGPIQKLAGNLIRNVTVDIMSKEINLIVIPEVKNEDSVRTNLEIFLNQVYRVPKKDIEVRFIRLFLGFEALIMQEGLSTFSHIEITISENSGNPAQEF